MKPTKPVYPPEVQKLIDMHGGVLKAAEKAVGVYNGYLGKMGRGKEPYTDYYKKKVEAALQGQTLPSTARGFVTSDHPKCPPLIGQLIIKLGSKKAAAKAMGTSEGYLYGVIDGSRDMLPAWTTRARAALGLPAVYSTRKEDMTSNAEETPAAAKLPEFVPWDGTKTSLAIQGRAGKKGRTIKSAPEPVAKLIEKFGGVNPAAATVGCAGNSLMQLAEGNSEFSEKWQRRVHAAMHGAPHREDKMGDTFDKYELGLAICLLKTAAYDHIATIAEILNARMVFRKSTAAGWIVIYRMKTEDLPKFKKIGIRDANEIVCP